LLLVVLISPVPFNLFIMSAEERKKTEKVQMICPGCLTVFIVLIRDSERKKKGTGENLFSFSFSVRKRMRD